jgi:hypothetical protein
VTAVVETNTFAFFARIKNDEKTLIILKRFSCHIFVALEKNLAIEKHSSLFSQIQQR